MLKELHLSNNRLTGPIPPPPELGNLSRLETGYLSGNYLTGCIPPSGPIQGGFQVGRKLERCKPEGEDGS